MFGHFVDIPDMSPTMVPQPPNYGSLLNLMKISAPFNTPVLNTVYLQIITVWTLNTPVLTTVYLQIHTVWTNPLMLSQPGSPACQC